MKTIVTKFEKGGDIYERCKTYPISSEKFVNKQKRIRFNGVVWAISNGYTPKAFTVVPENAAYL